MESLMKSELFEPYEPEVVLAVGAHADDIDFGASGSIAAWAKAGARVEYVVITDGSKGSADCAMTTDQLVQLRRDEQQAAAEVLGAHADHFLGYEDGQLEVTQDLKKKLVEIIRTVRPDTVVVLDPSMIYVAEIGFINHPDHRAAGQATLDAVFPLARDHLSFPDLYAKGLQPHKVAHVLLMNLERQNCFVDISDTMDLKLEALCKHASQIPDSEGIRDMLQDRARKMGRLAGCRYAESFVRIDTQP
ncbi:MAG TPA: PIG-L deacetylase family protein [Candidatus Saccharimonadales bacterium]|nr:PIG-L deacetylase family protein [Candidatus Saccharimonadales bacterium]